VETAILVRHGETESSVRGGVSGDPEIANPLTETGRDQARALGRLLAREHIDLCVTSAFPRTIETAEIALAGRDVPRLVVSELNDPRAGAFEGGPLSEYRAWARAARSVDVPPGGGESRRELVERYARAYRTVLERPERVILVVGHSLPTAYALRALDGDGPTPTVPLVAYAQPYRLGAEELAAVIDRLEAWVAAPTW
jgi:broad specificity phosphatase PhoE